MRSGPGSPYPPPSCALPPALLRRISGYGPIRNKPNLCDKFLYVFQGGPSGTARAADAAHRHHSRTLTVAAAQTPVGLARHAKTLGPLLAYGSHQGSPGEGRACPAVRLFRVGPEPV